MLELNYDKVYNFYSSRERTPKMILIQKKPFFLFVKTTFLFLRKLERSKTEKTTDELDLSKPDNHLLLKLLTGSSNSDFC